MTGFPMHWRSATAALLCGILWVQLAVAAPTITPGATEGTTLDLLDHSQGTRVAGSTRMLPGVSNVRNAIGFTTTLPPVSEAQHALFNDGALPVVDSFTFMSLAPITANSFNLHVQDDGVSNSRAITSFSVKASADGVNFTTISSGAVGPYDSITISDNAPVTVSNAQLFRVEVTRLNSGGPRIYEFDVFGAVGLQSQSQLQINSTLLNATTNSGGDEAAGLSTNFTASTMIAGDNIADAFGNNDGGVESNTFIFADGRTPDNGNATLGDGGESVDFIQWQTTSPVTLAGLELLLRSDAESSVARGTELIRILVEGVEVDFYDNNADGTNAGGNPLVRIFSNGPVTGDDFRIEFTNTTGSGARIFEINAITFQAAVPEPASLALWGGVGALGLLVGIWRRRTAVRR